MPELPNMEKPLALIKDLMEDFADRRRDLRYPCQLKGTIVTGQGPIACEITSLSSGGLSARCTGQLEKGSAVEVHRPGDDSLLKCQVQWASKASPDLIARLSLKQSPEGTWLEKELKKLGAQARESRQRRGVVRVKCQIPAYLSGPDRDEREALVLDLGTTGARVKCSGDPKPEEDLVLRFGPLDHLPAIALRAKLISTHDSEAMHHGVVFTGFESGSPRALLDYVNHVFTPRRG